MWSDDDFERLFYEKNSTFNQNSQFPAARQRYDRAHSWKRVPVPLPKLEKVHSRRERAHYMTERVHASPDRAHFIPKRAHPRSNSAHRGKYVIAYFSGMIGNVQQTNNYVQQWIQ